MKGNLIQATYIDGKCVSRVYSLGSSRQVKSFDWDGLISLTVIGALFLSYLIAVAMLIYLVVISGGCS